MPIIIVARSGPAGEDVVLSPNNKSMTASVTVNDGDLACVIPMAQTPPYNGDVMVLVNGREKSLSDGAADVNKCCYFSADGGTTARSKQDITLGDLLYWRQSVAGWNLDANDLISFVYDA